MNLEVGTKLHGFTVTRIRPSEELHGSLVEMVHDKTGAQLCWVDNGELNKLFCVGFKTLPENSTGVPHIIEHSVLCGSDKYPVKEPFVDLLKSSMNTFLNAMTGQDFTCYPVSSRNERDYLNLMEVYLDAVFAPAMLHNKNIFYQEGHHTEIAEDGTPSYKGVVFNEMKGALSQVDGRIQEDFQAQLFPDCFCYRVNSGGDPAVIPDLTFEYFVDFYKRHYHPSNARFFLDGSVPLDATLERIEGYLSRYERSDARFDIPVQTPKASENVRYYELDANQDPEKKAFLTLGKIVSTWQDKPRTIAAKVLCDYLADSNDSPLKRAILSAGLAEDFEMDMTSDCPQPYLSMTARNMKDSDSAKVIETVRATAEKLLAGGLDKEAVTAFINRMEFQSREGWERAPALGRAFQANSTWLYGGDPLDGLTSDKDFVAVRAMLDNGGFEALLKDMLLDETGLCILHTLPSHTMGAEEREREARRVAAEVAAMTPQQVEELKQANAALVAWQQSEDTPEQTATLPTLPLSEVGPEPVWTPTEELSAGGVKVLYHSVPSRGIVHLSLYFPLTAFDQADLPRLDLLTSLLGELPTRNKTAAQLQQAIKMYTGRLNFSTEVYAPIGKTETATPCLVASASVLESNLGKALELLAEILTQTDLTQTDRIREIVAQADEKSRQYAIGAGNLLALTVNRAHYSALGAAGEMLNGYTAISAIHTLNRDFDAQAKGLADFLTAALEKAVCRASLTVSITADAPVDLTALLGALPAGTAAPAQAKYTTELPHRLGITIPAQISFAVKSFHLHNAGMKHNGSLNVLSSIMSFGYLWSAIRIQGGAYGCGFRAPTAGDISFHSYRDPTPGRSLGVYDKAADFVRQFCAGDEALEKFIISTIGSLEPLQSARQQGVTADTLWFTGFTLEDMKVLRQQMLATTRESLLEWCPMLEQAAREGAVCVVGHEEALKACGELDIRSL